MNHEANDPNGEMPLERTQVPALEAILGQSFPVLDHGFIRIIDYMGSDDSIVQAARVSYGKGTRSLNDDTALIRYLMRNSHTTPFEMCEIKLHVKLPIFVARQWIRHRTANINEYSGRYSIINNQYYVPTQEAIAAQSAINRQGRGQSLDDMNAKAAIALIREDSERSYACYQALMGDETSSGPIEGGIAR
ncbi:MAG: FAD-dependent thymidylate synthase, partial [Methylocella sp.]